MSKNGGRADRHLGGPETKPVSPRCLAVTKKDPTMKRGCLLWVLGVPLPVVLILYFLFFR